MSPVIAIHVHDIGLYKKKICFCSEIKCGLRLNTQKNKNKVSSVDNCLHLFISPGMSKKQRLNKAAKSLTSHFLPPACF